MYQRLVILGEAMSRLAPSLKSRYPEVPWGLVIALRNRLVHGYFTLNQNLLWDISTNEIDETQRQLQSIKVIEFKDEQIEDE